MTNPSQKVLVVGASGQLGGAISAALVERGHQVVTVGRTSGDHRADTTDPEQIARLYEEVGQVDAVALANGHVPYKLLSDFTPADYEIGFRDKILSQIEMVRQGVSHVSERGSFTLISGVLNRAQIPTATAAAMANGAIEGFVRAAAVEIAPQRINGVSPTIFTESVERAGDSFPGFQSVPLSVVAATFVRSIEGAQTGTVFELGQ